MVPNAFAALFTWCWVHHRKDRTVLFALHMLIIPGKEEHHEKACGRDAVKMNLYPLAVSYLLNPAGIAALVPDSLAFSCLHANPHIIWGAQSLKRCILET